MVPVRPDSLRVGRHRVVREVTGDHRSQPSTLLGQAVVASSPQLVLELPQGRTHAVASRVAPKQECPAPRAATDEREPQEVERLRFALAGRCRAPRCTNGAPRCASWNKHWAKSCHEFRYYDSLVEVPSTAETPTPSEAKNAPPPPADPGAEMLKRAVRLLAETKGEAWVNKGSVWHMIKRLDPTFDPKDHGHANFAYMVKAMDAVVEIKKGETDHVLRVR